MPETDEERFKRLDAMRAPAKTTNYSATYKVGAPKLSREGGMPLKEAKAFLDAFWALNWSILKLEKDQYVKTLKDGSMWLKNPVSGFYYSLRYEKDIFSTLNQSTGVYIVDSWIMRMRKKGVNPSMQMHDEVVVYCKDYEKELVEVSLKEAMDEVNQSLGLNVTIEVDVQFGQSYGDVH